MKLIVRDLVTSALTELADESRQRRLWLASEGPEVSSFAECVSRLWDDSGLAAALDSGAPAFGADIDDELRELRELLREINPNSPPAVILEDRRLSAARFAARTLLDELRRLEKDAQS